MKKSKVPKPEEIIAEIAMLRKLKPSVRQRSMFGEDNHAAIEAQIYVLENNSDDDDIYNRYQPTDEETGEADESGNNRHELDCALEVRRWMDGHEKEPPSMDWIRLVT